MFGGSISSAVTAVTRGSLLYHGFWRSNAGKAGCAASAFIHQAIKPGFASKMSKINSAGKGNMTETQVTEKGARHSGILLCRFRQYLISNILKTFLLVAIIWSCWPKLGKVTEELKSIQRKWRKALGSLPAAFGAAAKHGGGGQEQENAVTDASLTSTELVWLSLSIMRVMRTCRRVATHC